MSDEIQRDRFSGPPKNIQSKNKWSMLMPTKKDEIFGKNARKLYRGRKKTFERTRASALFVSRPLVNKVVSETRKKKPSPALGREI